MDWILDSYLRQSVCVIWDSCKSEYLKMYNGVKQGRVILCHLFNLYIEPLLVQLGNIERTSTSRSVVRIPIPNESLYHATQKKNHGYSTSISMPTTRALIRADIDSDVDQHRGHVCSKTTRGVV